jgi:hypothetical protein
MNAVKLLNIIDCAQGIHPSTSINILYSTLYIKIIVHKRQLQFLVYKHIYIYCFKICKHEIITKYEYFYE